MAQSAKLLSENPLLVRLKELEELEASQELAGKVCQLNVVMGETALPMRQLK